jgi:hypothetical protein
MAIIGPDGAAVTLDLDAGPLAVCAKGAPAVSRNKVPIAMARDFLI